MLHSDQIEANTFKAPMSRSQGMGLSTGIGRPYADLDFTQPVLLAYQLSERRCSPDLKDSQLAFRTKDKPVVVEVAPESELYSR